MIAKLLETITGKDDVERVAYKDDPKLLIDYLKTRRLLIPKKPRHSLDAATCTREELMEMFKLESQELAGDSIELWILEIDGKKHLPAFSNQKKAVAFSEKISRDMDKVFSLGYFEALLLDVITQANVDFVHLNLFSKKSWEISVQKLK